MTAATYDGCVNRTLISPAQKVPEQVGPSDHNAIVNEVWDSQLTDKQRIIKNGLPFERKQDNQR